MDFARTARFYTEAPDDVLDRFEEALDHDDPSTATAIRDEFLATLRTAARREPEYLEEPAQPGDMVFLLTNNSVARLLAVSPDNEWAIVKQEYGAFPILYEKVRRIR